MKKFNAWNKWGKLNDVALGSCYPNNFFDSVQDNELRDVLTRVLEETNEDLDYFQKVMEEFGTTVHKVPVWQNSVDDFVNDETIKLSSNTPLISAPPMTPRDTSLIIGDTAWVTNGRKEYIQALKNYNLNGVREDSVFKNNRKMAAPQMTLVGRDLYVDVYDVTDPEEFKRNMKNLRDAYPEMRIHTLNIGGHNDGVFCVMGEGVLMSLVEVQNYSKTFPGWDLCYLKDESWKKVEGFRAMKKKTAGKWWIPGEEENTALLMYVEEWLDNWVGYVEESVFDVNNIMLDEKTMCVANPNNEIVRDYAKKHNIELVHVPWRHRYFWDGGLHCITLDLNREGEMEDYFPDRGNTIINDKGF